MAIITFPVIVLLLFNILRFSFWHYFQLSSVLPSNIATNSRNDHSRTVDIRLNEIHLSRGIY